jgi:hypothetical protein
VAHQGADGTVYDARTDYRVTRYTAPTAPTAEWDTGVLIRTGEAMPAVAVRNGQYAVCGQCT